MPSRKQLKGRGGCQAAPPFFFPTWMLLAALTMLAWSISTTSLAADQSSQGFRLAGTVAVGSGYLAFLEVPGGTRYWFAKATLLARRRSSKSAIVRLTCGSRAAASSSRSKGAGKPAPSGGRSDDVVKSQSDEGHVVRREVGGRTDAAGIERGRSGQGGTCARHVARRLLVTQRFAPVINLPPNSSIVAINGHAVSSEEGAVREVTKALAAGGAVTMNLKTPAGMERVYLLPAPAESASNDSLRAAATASSGGPVRTRLSARLFAVVPHCAHGARG